MSGKFIPLSIPNFEGNERKYVDDAIEQGWVSTGGAYINMLERKMADFLNIEEVAACQSGTAALHMSLVRCEVIPGDMVIVPTLTFIAAVNPVKYQFAEPVFMDCDDTLCMDPNKLRMFCVEECHLEHSEMKEPVLVHNQSGKHVKAIVVVHIFGNLADMEKIMEIAQEFHLKVIEDATEALGTKYVSGKYAGCYAGTIGDYGAYSFNGNKIITTGGGGAVVARAPGETAHIRYLSTQAKDDEHYYIHNEIGYNYRMTNVQAAIGAAQMEELPEFIRRKQENYEFYKAEFANVSDVKLLPFREETSSNKWFYALELPIEKMNCDLRGVITRLQDEFQVQVRAIWGLIHEQLPYQQAIAYKIEKAKYYSERIINIPCSTQISTDEMLRVVAAIKSILKIND